MFVPGCALCSVVIKILVRGLVLSDGRNSAVRLLTMQLSVQLVRAQISSSLFENTLCAILRLWGSEAGAKMPGAISAKHRGILPASGAFPSTRLHRGRGARTSSHMFCGRLPPVFAFAYRWFIAKVQRQKDGRGRLSEYSSTFLFVGILGGDN